MTQTEINRLMKQLEILERHPKTAFAEGFRRTANILDELNYVYTAVSSGKDSLLMTNLAILEILRRRYIVELLDSEKKEDNELAKELMERYNRVRKSGLASQNEDTIENLRKWAEKDRRIGVMQMDYEMSFDQTNEVMHRFYKEFATDFSKIVPEGKEIDESKTVKEQGFDLRWVNYKNRKMNPYMLEAEEIENMKPSDLRDIYGKALVYGYGMYFAISWQNTGSVSDSRYISFDPNKKDIWVNHPPVEFDPHREWCITTENMYEEWHGLRPMYEIYPMMTDQQLRVEFSKYITNALNEKWAEEAKAEN